MTKLRLLLHSNQSSTQSKSDYAKPRSVDGLSVNISKSKIALPEKTETFSGSEKPSQSRPTTHPPTKVETEGYDPARIEIGTRAEDESPASKEVSGPTSDELQSGEAGEGEVAGKKYPTGVPFFLLTLALMATTFIAGLDQNIISTALPKITTEFDSLNDVALYQSAYGIGQMVAQPTFGRIYTYFNTKWLFVISLFIFEVGSIICAAAPTSLALIIGRAVAGVGFAGLYSGALLVIVDSMPLRQRPLYISVVTSMFAVSGVAGPLLGGLFTDSKRLTWRFCFWINLPIGAPVLVAVLTIFKPETPEHANLSLKEKIKRLDLLGAAFLVPAVALLQIALQRGGTTHPWTSPKVWGYLLAFGILITIFVFLQIRAGDRATIPPYLLSNRNVLSSNLFAASYGISAVIHIVYLPFYFQSIKNSTASQSGIRILPYCISTTLGVGLSGVLITAFGHYVPFMFLGGTVLAVGSGLLYTLHVTSSIGQWFGYQVVAAFGFGLGVQIPYVVVQNVLSAEEVPTGTALIVFSQNFAGAVAITVAQNLVSHTLLNRLSKIPGVRAPALIAAGATEIRNNVDPGLLGRVLDVYNFSLTRTFLLPIGAGVAAFLVTLGMEWRKIEKSKGEVPRVIAS